MVPPMHGEKLVQQLVRGIGRIAPSALSAFRRLPVGLLAVGAASRLVSCLRLSLRWAMSCQVVYDVDHVIH